MNVKQLVNKLLKISGDVTSIEKALVYSFADKIAVDTNKSQWLKNYLSDIDYSIVDKVNQITESKLTLNELIAIFEMLVPQSEKKEKGVVYTPEIITRYIVSNTLNCDSVPTVLDPSCGCGAFLVTAAKYMHERYGISYSEIVSSYLYGVDIDSNAIDRIKSLLSLIVLMNGEEEKCSFNFICSDTLDKKTYDRLHKMQKNGFDCVVGNPPYVRNKNMSEDTKRHLTNWVSSSIGNVDLYIPFFEIGLTALNQNGLLGYITVNTFFKSVNARTLRNYFVDNHLSLSIVDFGQQLVFKKKLAYTCRTFMSKKQSESLLYVKADVADVEAQKNFVYSRINYSSLDNHRGWHLNRNEVLENIRLIENAGEALGDKYVIKNGIATLANDVFIFRPVRTDENYHYLTREGKEYAIEKDICRDIIKPNILKSEAEISEKEEKIISPYDIDCNVIAEEFFVANYPNAYKYLQDCRDVLDKRDKGEGEYEAWYAFGRTQAIADSGKKLLFPYMSDLPHFVYTSQKDMMIYCGYAIYNESETELLFLKKVLESSVFDYYMKNTSKPYSTGYYSYAKNYVKSFGIYPFTEEQKQHLLSLKSKEEIDEYIREIYQVAI